MLRIWFDRGTLRFAGPRETIQSLPGVLWDPRTHDWRAAAHRYGEIARAAAEQSIGIDDAVARSRRSCPGHWVSPGLRPYQEQAVIAWRESGKRGVVCMPTGSGKTRVAVAALAAARCSALILCPTRALLSEWSKTLSRWYSGPVGIVGDGERRIEAVTVMTFESAYRHMDELGAPFELLVVDEVHHFAGGLRCEALEMSPATARIGLTATPPADKSPGRDNLAELVGPIVCEVSLGELVGTHLARLEMVRLRVNLAADERARYEQLYRPFAELYAAFARGFPEAPWSAFVASLQKSKVGRRALQGYRLATQIAAFPRAKQSLTSSLLRKHRPEKTLVFTAFAENAYAIARANLVPMITAEVGRTEREEILSRFKAGTYRAIVSARVLNEGLDVPDANVAILVAGSLGDREHIQRLGRILRPQPGKEALAYELTTTGTVDDYRARARSRRLAA